MLDSLHWLACRDAARFEAGPYGGDGGRLQGTTGFLLRDYEMSSPVAGKSDSGMLRSVPWLACRNAG